MAQVSTIRYTCLCRRRAAISTLRRMRWIVWAFTASRTRRGAVESPVFHDCVVPQLVLGFRLARGKKRHPLAIHRATYSGGMTLCLSPALLRHRFGPIRRPGGTAPLCFAFTTPSHKERASGTPAFSALRVLVPPQGAPPKKARLGLGSRALREAPPGVP